ncbi:phytanoyl-CoA dioxygenase family protein [Bradyrhizobium sp.]|jgi:hypothetical protein|uniref:phytanoyl-CoA dioxygenase family protein n=1 Tax=Bradyrhizobium sp. TaxID=376 RepID=UPI002E070246|nr:phytanoyl-CoA dioxygenase family protein [Bradyrhizobium sp.]
MSSDCVSEIRDIAREIRDVTQDEIEHYKKNGWVKLEKLFAPEIVEKLLQRAKERMGQDPLSVSRADPGSRVSDAFKWYSRWDSCSYHDEWICAVSHSRELARIATRLMGVSVRFYFDQMFVKVPATKMGTETPWHQDLPHHPFDRHGALGIWAALVDCPPEKGAMRFLNGTHRAGLFGRFSNRTDGVSLIDENPWLLDQYEISPPLDLRPGDATVHDFAVVHCAPANTTDSPRWVYLTQWAPAGALYTGAPNHRTVNLGLEIDKPLLHERFPVIAV